MSAASSAGRPAGTREVSTCPGAGGGRQSLMPSHPGAAWSQPPNIHTPNTREAWAAMLPPWDAALLTADTVFQLSSVRENILGHYPLTHFLHPPARELAAQFKKQLAEIE